MPWEEIYYFRKIFLSELEIIVFNTGIHSTPPNRETINIHRNVPAFPPLRARRVAWPILGRSGRSDSDSNSGGPTFLLLPVILLSIILLSINSSGDTFNIESHTAKRHK